jgi:hypothetical protein
MPRDIQLTTLARSSIASLVRYTSHKLSFVFIRLRTLFFDLAPQLLPYQSIPHSLQKHPPRRQPRHWPHRTPSNPFPFNSLRTLSITIGGYTPLGVYSFPPARRIRGGGGYILASSVSSNSSFLWMLQIPRAWGQPGILLLAARCSLRYFFKYGTNPCALVRSR